MTRTLEELRAYVRSGGVILTDAEWEALNANPIAPPGLALSDFDAASRLVEKRREVDRQLRLAENGSDAWVLQFRGFDRDLPSYKLAASRVRALLEADLAANTAALERLGVRTSG